MMESDKYLTMLAKAYELSEQTPSNSEEILKFFKEFVLDESFNILEEDDDDYMTDGVYDPDKDPYWGGWGN